MPRQRYYWPCVHSRKLWRLSSIYTKICIGGAALQATEQWSPLLTEDSRNVLRMTCRLHAFCLLP